MEENKSQTAQWNRFYAYCKLISTLANPTKIEKVRSFSRKCAEGKSLVLSSTASSGATRGIDRLLDALAILVSSEPKGGIVAVSLVGLTRDKINVLAATDLKPDPIHEKSENKEMKELRALAPGSSGRAVTVTSTGNLRNDKLVTATANIERFGKDFCNLVSNYHRLGRGKAREEIYRNLMSSVLSHAGKKFYARFRRCVMFIKAISEILPNSSDETDKHLRSIMSRLREGVFIKPEFNISLTVKINRDESVNKMASNYLQQFFKSKEPFPLSSEFNEGTFWNYHRFFAKCMADLESIFDVPSTKFEASLKDATQVLEIIQLFNLLYILIESSVLFRKYITVVSYLLLEDPVTLIDDGPKKQRLFASSDSDDNNEEALENSYAGDDADDQRATYNVGFKNLWVLMEHVVAAKTIPHSEAVKALLSKRDVYFKVLDATTSRMVAYNLRGEPSALPRNHFADIEAAIKDLLEPNSSLETKDFFNALSKYEANQIKKGRPAAIQVTPSVHAEMILLAYLNGEAFKQRPVVHDYIGISKATCVTCDLAMFKQMKQPEQVHGVIRKAFRCRGSHGHVLLNILPVYIQQKYGYYIQTKIRSLASIIVTTMAKNHQTSRSPDSGILDLGAAATAEGDEGDDIFLPEWTKKMESLTI